ncbi:MAG TPA: M20/M25/M40 family metallo-hydrolase [Gemmatimonadales bacterium]|nr:M20/M25/M40 family metallo-hydrolase [Gemmatimonadales bacterium]
MRRILSLVALVFISAGATVLPQQSSIPRLLRPALDSLRAHNEWTLAQQQSICEIPAPSNHEERRAVELKRRFEALGLQHVRIDSMGNVIGERPGSRRRPLVVLSAHLDTVFPEGTDLRVRREGTLLRGPGIGDDCRGLAVILAVARALQENPVRTDGSLLFVGTVGEEAAGRGRGVTYLLQRELPEEVDFFLTVDLGDFEITNRAVGSMRYRVSYFGPGGHSFESFGMPNPIHALGRAIATISDFQVPADPRSTFNVGIVQGGRAVNAIADTAAMTVEVRSVSAEELGRLNSLLFGAVTGALRAERNRWRASTVPIGLKIDTLNIRPAGQVADSAPIMRAALAAGRMLGVATPLTAHSTDANVAIAMGIPAIGLGHGGRGRGEHSLVETYDDGDQGYLGPQWATLIATALTGLR